MKKHNRKVIINADDFGLTPGVTCGILYAHQKGVVSSTTAMVNTPFAKQSLDEAKKYPKLGIGLHWVLDAGQPVFSNRSSLTDNLGNFLKGELLMKSAKKQDLKNELEAQLELINEWYGSITHIDSHHHLHLHNPSAMEVVLEVAARDQIPIRTYSQMEVKEKVVSADFFYDHFYNEENVSKENFLNILSNLKSGITEIMCHPAFLDLWLKDISSYTDTRMKELEILTAKEIKDLIMEQAIEIIHYGGVANED
ncbi:carbohydrate deacetylase [Amphibacillus sp. Q70]|uniref:carbohydrate deacetylase n=1 Tax=Amphibacillus sp. Q70 TaxID=3453416 RepID=UPI003F87D065